MTTINTTDTIAAPATPPGRGGVAVIRISGPLAESIAKQILKKTLKPRYATYTVFWDNQDQAIDEGLALFFPSPNSFTGEDVIELHGHGGPAVIDCLIKRILSLGARLARPGEFSERAFLNNKLDLAQAEAIADLINASSEQAVRASVRSLQGEFSKKIHEVLQALIHLRSFVEAGIDFTEEEIDFFSDNQIKTQLTTIISQLETIQGLAKQGSLLREGLTAVITGVPNVGKSSLLNALSGKDVAIVTDIAGTTRDVLREQIVLDGMPIHFIDTAGLRDTHHVIEQEGIKRAKDEVKRADLILYMVDAREHNLEKDFYEEINHCNEVIIIRNKIDLTNEKPEVTEYKGKKMISVSIKNNLGIPLLIDQIKASAGLQTNTEGIFSARRRHLDAMIKTKEFLISGLNQNAPELLAEDLRQAQKSLSEITGEFTSDDLLGKIFSSFCIGK